MAIYQASVETPVWDVTVKPFFYKAHQIQKNLNVSRLVLLPSLPNPLEPGIKLTAKM